MLFSKFILCFIIILGQTPWTHYVSTPPNSLGCYYCLISQRPLNLFDAPSILIVKVSKCFTVTVNSGLVNPLYHLTSGPMALLVSRITAAVRTSKQNILILPRYSNTSRLRGEPLPYPSAVYIYLSVLKLIKNTSKIKIFSISTILLLNILFDGLSYVVLLTV